MIQKRLNLVFVFLLATEQQQFVSLIKKISLTGHYFLLRCCPGNSLIVSLTKWILSITLTFCCIYFCAHASWHCWDPGVSSGCLILIFNLFGFILIFVNALSLILWIYWGFLSVISTKIIIMETNLGKASFSWCLGAVEFICIFFSDNENVKMYLIM